MLAYIIFIVFIIVLTFIFCYFDGMDNFIFNLCCSLLIYLCIEFVVLFWLLGSYQTVGEYEIFQYNISGLENKTQYNKELNGIFILGVGKIKGNENEISNYYFFKETDYGKTLESIPMSSTVYIRELEDCKPCLKKVVEKQIYIENSLSKFFIQFWKNGDVKVTEKATILEVPIGTIQIDYNIEI